LNALDTNVLVRFLVADDERQASLARQALRDAEAKGEALFVPAAVALETIWVLESVYRIDRDGILDALRQLLLMPALRFEHRDALLDMLEAARSSRLDLPDLLIAHVARASGCDRVLTFDRRACSSPLFASLEEAP